MSFYNWYNYPKPSGYLAIGKIIFLYLCVQVPVTDLQSRYCHCAAAFTLSPGIAEVVLFGGSNAIVGTAHIKNKRKTMEERKTMEGRCAEIKDEPG